MRGENPKDTSILRKEIRRIAGASGKESRENNTDIK